MEPTGTLKKQFEWDDVRLFLALVRAGSVRGAAAQLGVSHATVSRRVSAFEGRIGVKLFDRLPTGITLTHAGEDMLVFAERVENEFDEMQRRMLGRDQQLAGNIRVTMVDVLATHLLMADLTRFREQYPNIDLEVMISYESLDLTRREADVAIRFVKNPADHLIGQRIGTALVASYATKAYLDSHDLNDAASVTWIGYGSSDAYPKWVKGSAYPHIPARGVFDSMLLQLEAARCGMGIANIPCFLGDPDPTLIRLPPGKPDAGFHLWLLRHQDTRSTARLRVFSQFMTEAVKSHRQLLEGESTMRD